MWLRSMNVLCMHHAYLHTQCIPCLRPQLAPLPLPLPLQAMQQPAGFTGRWLLHQLDCTQLEETHQKQHQQPPHEGPAAQGPSAQQQQAQQAQQGGAGAASRQLLDLPEELVDSCLLGKRSAEEYVRGVMAAGGRRRWQAQGAPRLGSFVAALTRQHACSVSHIPVDTQPPSPCQHTSSWLCSIGVQYRAPSSAARSSRPAAVCPCCPCS